MATVFLQGLVSCEPQSSTVSTDLQVALNVAQKRNVTDTSGKKEEHRASKNYNGESGGDREGSSDQVVALEICRWIPPITLALLGQVEGI